MSDIPGWGLGGRHSVGPDTPPLRGFPPALLCILGASLGNTNQQDDPVGAHVNRAFVTEILEFNLQTAPHRLTHL